MPPEWARHERTWMAFPPEGAQFGTTGGTVLGRSRRAWAGVARAVARYEPLTLVTAPGEREVALDLVGPTRHTVTVVERPLDDAWMRDMGPTFLLGPDGTLGAADWVFNGWGASSWASWEHDQHVAEEVCTWAGAARFTTWLVNEGGGLHVDGEGTVLLTETVQLGEGRNAHRDRAEVEAEVHAMLGTTHAIWLPRGLTADYGPLGTRGHVDIVACFSEPGTVLVHHQPDPAHPDHEVSREVIDLLGHARDARGRALTVVPVDAPTVLEHDGEPVDYSYINHYVLNDAVLLCAFDDPRDWAAREVLARAYPTREVVLVPATDIFAMGGGIHCITQQQPARAPSQRP